MLQAYPCLEIDHGYEERILKKVDYCSYDALRWDEFLWEANHLGEVPHRERSTQAE